MVHAGYSHFFLKKFGAAVGHLREGVPALNPSRRGLLPGR
jgi:hypothetical protein